MLTVFNYVSQPTTRVNPRRPSQRLLRPQNDLDDFLSSDREASLLPHRLLQTPGSHREPPYYPASINVPRWLWISQPLLQELYSMTSRERFRLDLVRERLAASWATSGHLPQMIALWAQRKAEAVKSSTLCTAFGEDVLFLPVQGRICK